MPFGASATGSPLLDDQALERSWVVANREMNRRRGLAGVNSYARELGFDPLMVLRDRLTTARGQPSRSPCPVAWLDLCCGEGRALLTWTCGTSDRQAARPPAGE